MIDSLRVWAAITALACLVSGSPAAAQTGKLAGHVAQQRGTVTALSDATPRVLHLGADLFLGDRIITGNDARVRIEFLDGSVLSVGARSQIEIADFAFDADGFGVRGVLSLLVGIVRSTLSGDRWNDGFEVRSRAAVASVRSTDWITEVREDRTSVFVVDGTVEVASTGPGPAVQLGQGFGTDVPLGGAPSPPNQWGQVRVQDVLSRTQVP